jgi:DNA adenine methylase
MRGLPPEPVYTLLDKTSGKRILLSHLLDIVPSKFERYFEPFFGGGALFFALQPPRAYLSDSNAELINCYREVAMRPRRVMSYLATMKNSLAYYHKMRSLETRVRSARAARLIYLTTLSFNGMYRENRLGQFNVPYGGRSHMNPLQPERLRGVSRALRGARLECLDFETSLRRARRHDLVYLDPPYTVAHDDNGFRRYNAQVFSWEDQARLAMAAQALDSRGCYVMITNACHPSIKALYRGLSQIPISRASLVAASSSHRRPVRELIITNLA